MAALGTDAVAAWPGARLGAAHAPTAATLTLAAATTATLTRKSLEHGFHLPSTPFGKCHPLSKVVWHSAPPAHSRSSPLGGASARSSRKGLRIVSLTPDCHSGGNGASRPRSAATPPPAGHSFHNGTRKLAQSHSLLTTIVVLRSTPPVPGAPPTPSGLDRADAGRLLGHSLLQRIRQISGHTGHDLSPQDSQGRPHGWPHLG